MELIGSPKGYLLLAVLIITGMCHTNNITQSNNICTLNSKDVFLEAVGLRTCILTPLAVNDVPNSKLALQSSHDVWAISELDDPNVYTRSPPMRPSNTTSLKSFQTWNFAPKQILPAVFPIEEEGNFIRRSIPNVIFSKAYPSPLRTKPVLAAYSKEVIKDLLDIDPDRFGGCSDFLQLASGSVVHNNHPIPLAHRYGGHQFGFWAGQLGDGRAHLLGEYVNDIGEHLELQLKGSGKTPYSRDGDGRAVIRSSVREFLCSEAMHYLGIPSSRAASLVVSEDIVWRDQFYSGNPKPEKAAVVLRVAKSWFRIGSLEILSQNSEIHELKLLVDFIIKEYFLMVDPWDLNKYLRFFSEVVSSTTKLIALWQSVGFAHGVMNTDNFSILSITIDYGPFGFLDEYDPKMVPNTSDDEGMYRFEKQPDVAKYNMNKLRMALTRLLSADQQRQAQHILDGFDPLYKTEFMNIFRQKFGLVDQDDDDQNLVATWLKILEDLKGDYTMCFRQLGEWSLPAMESGHIDQKLWALNEISHHKSFHDWVQHYLWRIKSYKINDDERRRTMQQINPRYILRNWIAQKAITQTENGDFSFLNRIHTILKHPYLEQKDAESAGFADRPPLWAKTLRVSCSS